MQPVVSTKFSLTFNRTKGRYFFSYNEKTFEQNVCEFMQTISYLVGKDVEEYLLSTDSKFDTVRIPLTGCGKSITLDLVDFIAFREVYSQEMFMLRLEDMLLRQGVQSAVRATL